RLYCRHIGNLCDLPCFKEATKTSPRRRFDNRLISVMISKCEWCVVKCNAAEALSVRKPENPKCRFANPRGVRQHGRKHRLKIAGRTTDNLKNLERSGLLLQSLRKIGGALP